MKYYRMYCINVRKEPILKQIIFSILYSWTTMLVTGLILMLIFTLTENPIKTDVSRIGSSFTLVCLFTTVYFLPINLFILLIIQFSRLLPFIMSSRLLVCIESFVFIISTIITEHLLFPNTGKCILVSITLVIIISFIFKMYVKYRHRRDFLSLQRIMKASCKCHLINKEVDMFILTIIISLLTLIFFVWQ